MQINIEYATSACSGSTDTSFFITVVTLDTFINPTNASNPELAYTSPLEVVFQSQSYVQFSIKVDQSTVNTDNSILPFESIDSRLSTKAQGDVRSLFVASSIPKTTIWIENSGSRTTYNRSFLKLLDAVAFVGGIFNSLLGIFFFMNGFGRLMYEMEFTSKYFKDKDARHSGFVSYLKHSVYGALTAVNCRPNWPNI